MTLRTRILLTLAPLLLLTAALGGADAVLLSHISARIDAILRDNLRSVDYMADLKDALDEIDDSFRLTLLGREGGRARYEEGWGKFQEQRTGCSTSGRCATPAPARSGRKPSGALGRSRNPGHAASPGWSSCCPGRGRR